ncbi:MAG TPA: hypothetical protein DG753_12055 [Clostridium sp.]|nr:hypothetical protein [Clostridium sp.]
MKFRNVLKISVAVICCGIVMFNFIGCRSYEKEKKEALEYLNNKYGEEFELKGNFHCSYGDEFNQSPEKETKAWPKDSSNDVFKIEYYPNGSYKDDYQNIVMKPFIDKYYFDQVNEYWNNSQIAVYVQGGLTNEKFCEEEVKKFLENSNINLTLIIYLKYTNEFDLDSEINKIYSLYRKVEENKFYGQLSINFIDIELSDNQVKEDKLWQKLWDDKHIVKYCLLRCTDDSDKKEVTKQKIREELKTKRESN